ncbi:UNVERIFIED_CONTAM: hypothetical protein GTU68_022012, partial [Idotea baltica]|nr:hypothetical protein [Idotea baltica]
MIDNGIISSQHLGLFTLLPLGVRAVEKLIKLLDLQMKKVNGQKLSLPFLTSASLWKKSGRLETCGAEIMSLKDRHNHHLILSPTHEEAITDLVSSENLVQSNLPVRLYQIASKFRDEMRLKHGLMRGREFVMKDLYTFDENLERAQYTYEEICKTYMNIFNILGL